MDDKTRKEEELKVQQAIDFLIKAWIEHSLECDKYLTAITKTHRIEA